MRSRLSQKCYLSAEILSYSFPRSFWELQCPCIGWVEFIDRVHSLASTPKNKGYDKKNKKALPRNGCWESTPSHTSWKLRRTSFDHRTPKSTCCCSYVQFNCLLPDSQRTSVRAPRGEQRMYTGWLCWTLHNVESSKCEWLSQPVYIWGWLTKLLEISTQKIPNHQEE